MSVTLSRERDFFTREAAHHAVPRASASPPRAAADQLADRPGWRRRSGRGSARPPAPTLGLQRAGAASTAPAQGEDKPWPKQETRSPPSPIGSPRPSNRRRRASSASTRAGGSRRAASP